MIKGWFIDKCINELAHCFNKSDNSTAILITCDNISRAMVMSNFYQKPCFTCLSGADPHGFHCFTEIGQIFHYRLLSCKASSEEKKLAKLSCLNDSETQERGRWKVKIEKNFPLGHAPGPPKACAMDFGWHRFRFSPCLMRKRVEKSEAILALLDSFQCISNGKPE